MTDDEDFSRNDSATVEAAMALRPRWSDTTVSADLPGGTIVWSDRGSVGLLTFLSAAVWPHLDGEATLGELADDLSEASGTPLLAIRDFLTSFAYELDHGGFATGAAVPRESSDETDEARGTFEEVRDGVRYLVTEIDVTRGQVQQMTGGEASVAELVPTDSCAGQRMQLDRPGEVVSVHVHGRSLAVRTTVPEIADWLRTEGEPGPTRGPAVALVASNDTGRRTRYRVFDQDTLMVSSGTDLAAVRFAVRSLLLNEIELTPPDGFVEARVQLLHRDGVGVIAPIGALARPRGVDRQLARLGIVAAPTRRVFLSTDGLTALEPVLESVAADGGITWREHRIVGAWARGNREGEVDVAQKVVVLLRNSTATTWDDRAALIGAVRNLVDTCPVVVSFRTDLSTLAVSAEVASLFGPIG